MKKYLAISERNVGKMDDLEQKVFDTQEEADNYARTLWNHLTSKEKKEWHIYVGVVTEEDLDKNLLEEDEEGNKIIDWTAWAFNNPIGFDSKNCR